MPPAEGGDARRDGRLSPEELKRLADSMTRMYPTEERTTDFLLRVMGIPPGTVSGFFHGPHPGSYETPGAYWRRIVPELVTGGHIDLLARSVHQDKQVTPDFDALFPRDEAAPEADQTAGPRVNGCHVIVLTTNEGIRARIRNWLEEVGLAPLQVWANHDMTSFSVANRNVAKVRAQIQSAYGQLLIRVLKPREQDTLLDWLDVSDAYGVELRVPEVPVQLTFGEFGESSARFHPAAASMRDPLPGNQNEQVHLTRSGIGKWPLVDTTLLQSKVREDHRAEIRSLKFAAIRVVFVAANPQWNGHVNLGDVNHYPELAVIEQAAERGRIVLVDKFLSADSADLARIMAKDPDVLHISCHASGGQLYWQDRRRDPDALTAGWLAEQIRAHAGRRLSGIVLSACDGESTGEAFITAALTVIAHPGRLTSNLAEEFTATFYNQLSITPVLRTAAERTSAIIKRPILVFPK